MTRLLKQPEVRMNEILDVAEELFNQKGYNQTSTNNIIEKACIARGTLYYYFKSKDEILDTVIKRSIDRNITQINALLQATPFNALEKLKLIVNNFFNSSCESTELLESLHKNENILMHQKSIVQSIKSFTPVIAEIIVQGINEGHFETQYPQEIIEFILVIFGFMFDPSIFQWCQEDYFTKIKAIENVLESSLQSKRGSFSFISESFENLYNRINSGGKK